MIKDAQANAQLGEAKGQVLSTYGTWTATMLDSGGDSATQQGMGNQNFSIACDIGGIYSIVCDSNQRKSNIGFQINNSTVWSSHFVWKLLRPK
jgi:hypothetical protein